MRLLDQHFTDAEDAKRLVASLVERYDPARCRYYLEPSCGGGAFVDALLAAGVPRNQIRSTDVDLKLPADVHGDFLESTRESLRIEDWPHETTVVIGNPPFGRNGDKCRAFINKAAEYGKLIAFVVPRGMQGADCCGTVNAKLELIWERQVGKFETTTARCNWQIWFLGNEPAYRPVEPTFDAKGLYKFVEPADADVIIRRVGSRAGLVDSFDGTGAGSLYFIRVASPAVLRALQMLNPTDLADLTTHQLSVSQPLLQKLLEERLLKDAIAKAARPTEIPGRWCLDDGGNEYRDSAAGYVLPERCYRSEGTITDF